MDIGDWVRRRRVGAKWHLVESVIAGDAVTRCGRRMRDHSADHPISPLERTPVQPLTRLMGQPQLCQVCDE